MDNHLKKNLHTTPNPYKSKACCVSVLQEITLDKQMFLLGLRYFPDKLLLDHKGLAAYLGTMVTRDGSKVEALAHSILEDIMDQIIPKWIEITLKQQQNKFGQTVLVTMEDRQPNWQDDALLSRLPALKLTP